MTHPAAYELPHGTPITECAPHQVGHVVDAVMSELDMIRCGAYTGGIEERLDRLEIAVVALATAVSNGSMGR